MSDEELREQILKQWGGALQKMADGPSMMDELNAGHEKAMRELSPEFLAAADVEADTPITVRPPLTDAEKEGIREMIRRTEAMDAADPRKVMRLVVLEMLAEESQKMGFYEVASIIREKGDSAGSK